MTTYDVYPIPIAEQSTVSDPRGGPIVDFSANGDRFNNLHMPYRGGGDVQTPFDAAGRECGYIWPLPYRQDESQEIAMRRILAHVRQNNLGNGGGNQQRWADGIAIGVSANG